MASSPLSPNSWETSDVATTVATTGLKPAAPTAEVAATAPKSSFLRVFSSTFVTIFLAELGDKTQMTTLLMSAESHAPWIVFLGAGSALIATSLIGVIVGQWLARRLSPQTLDTAAGILLLTITVGLLWDVFAA